MVYSSNSENSFITIMNAMHVQTKPQLTGNPRENRATRIETRYEKWKLARKGKSRWQWLCKCFYKNKDDTITEPLYTHV